MHWIGEKKFGHIFIELFSNFYIVYYILLCHLRFFLLTSRSENNFHSKLNNFHFKKDHSELFLKKKTSHRAFSFSTDYNEMLVTRTVSPIKVCLVPLYWKIQRQRRTITNKYSKFVHNGRRVQSSQRKSNFSLLQSLVAASACSLISRCSILNHVDRLVWLALFCIEYYTLWPVAFQVINSSLKITVGHKSNKVDIWISDFTQV